MAQQQPYTDISTVKAFLQLNDNDTTQDPFLAAIIPMAQTFIDRYTGRSFGWGDTDINGSLIDDVNTDYSNSDCIVITSTVLNGLALTLNFGAPVPWQVGNTISLYGSTTATYNGVWAVTTRNSPVQLVIDISSSKGTLNASNSTITLSGNGYAGNYVSNFKYMQQEQHDGGVNHEVYLRNMDIRSVESVYLGVRNISSPQLLYHTDFSWRDDGRLVLGGSYFNTYDSSNYGDNGGSFYGAVASGLQTIIVSYYCGYVGVPPEISLAAIDLVVAYHMLRKGVGLRLERVGDYEVEYDMLFRKLLQTQPDNLNTLNIMRRRKV